MDAAGRSALTPYAASKVANRLLAAAGVKRHYTEQTMYGFAKSGAIASNRAQWLADGGKASGYKVEFDGDAFYAWMQRTASGTSTPSVRHDYDALADEFALDAE